MLRLWFVANSILWPFSVEISGLKLGLNVVVLVLVGSVWILRKSRISTFSAKVLLGFSVFFLFSFLASTTGICTDKHEKFLYTSAALFLLTLVGLEIGWRSTGDDWLRLHSAASWVLLLAFTGFLFEALLPEFFPYQAGYRLEGKLSGLFPEPSHAAYSLIPSVAILLVSRRVQLKRKGILALIGLVLLSRSSMLVALIMLWLAYRLTVSRKIKLDRGLLAGLILLAVVVMVSLSNYNQSVEPFLSRAVGVVTIDETRNLTSLVYVQGWQDAWTNLRRTNGLGLGFNMMGCFPLPDVHARNIIKSIFHIGINAEDGSFLFSKLVSESGVIGILFFTGIVWWWIRIEATIRKYNNIETVSILSIFAALMFLFIASSLLRSPGYFSGSLLLLVVVVAGAAKFFSEHKFEHAK